jgi:hypothetical protein
MKSKHMLEANLEFDFDIVIDGLNWWTYWHKLRILQRPCFFLAPENLNLNLAYEIEIAAH